MLKKCFFKLKLQPVIHIHVKGPDADDQVKVKVLVRAFSVIVELQTFVSSSIGH